MDRSLQSALEKRSRLGAWQPRVYRLERGYLSAWPDVVSAAKKEVPSKTECLWQERQVAVLTDQGDRRFRLDFPWIPDPSTRTLQLRATNTSMKKAWTDLLTATINEATSQIKGTGAVFAYGGAARHEADQAYEEAAYIKTNRFLAAYVVDEQLRASYVNDHLNENFQNQTRVAGGEGGALRACGGADSAVDELLALMQDFKDEMQGVEELRQQGDVVGGLDPSVAAPKIRRFCESHLALTGRLVASRLMLELAPFMDASVARTTVPASSTQALVATRRKMDEMYAASERLLVSGQRHWLMDIRGTFLDCSGLQNAASAPAPVRAPSPKPLSTLEPDLEHAEPFSSPAAHAQPVSPRRPSKMFLQVTNAMSAAKAATMKGSFKGSSTSSSEELSGRADGETRQGAAAPTTSITSRFPGIPSNALSIKVFKRGPRAQQVDPSNQHKPPSQRPREGDVSPQRIGGDADAFLSGGPQGFLSTSEYDRSDGRVGRFGDISSQALIGAPSANTSVGGSSSGALPPEASPGGVWPATDCVETTLTAPIAVAASECSAERRGRKGRRAFAGGLWGDGGTESATTSARGGSPQNRASEPNICTAGYQSQKDTPKPVEASIRGTNGTPKPAVAGGGGKRTFAGGIMSSGSVSAQSTALSAPIDSRPCGENSTIGDGVGANGGIRNVLSSSLRGSSSYVTKKPADAEPIPAWAVTDDSAVLEWAREGKNGRVAYDGGGRAETNGGPGYPSSSEPSRGDMGKKSPLFAPEADIPVSVPNPRRVQRGGGGGSGEGGGSRRAFGGGQSLF